MRREALELALRNGDVLASESNRALSALDERDTVGVKRLVAGGGAAERVLGIFARHTGCCAATLVPLLHTETGGELDQVQSREPVDEGPAVSGEAGNLGRRSA